MSLPVEEQLQAYFTDLDHEQEAINLASIAAAQSSASGRLTIDAGEPGVDRAVEVELVITPLEREETMTLKPSTLLLLAAAAVVVIAGVFFAIESGSDDSSPVISDEVPVSTTAAPQEGVNGAGSSDGGSDPAAVLDAYVAAYNLGDVEAVMAFYSDASVVLGFPFNDEQRGLESIRSEMIQDIAAAAASDALTISNVAVSGNEVTWDQVWVNNGGEEFCVEGQTAVIERGKILLFTWPPDPPTQCG